MPVSLYNYVTFLQRDVLFLRTDITFYIDMSHPYKQILVNLQFQGHNTAGLFSVRILLLLSIFACARSYGELIGIRHASCIFFFAFLSMAVSPSLFKEQALYILILLRRHFPCYDAQVLQLSNMILQWNTYIYL